MLISDGNKMEAIGSGFVVIVDGTISATAILLIFRMAALSALKI
jgi:hypothetical protein